jgi:hypothetical protein
LNPAEALQVSSPAARAGGFQMPAIQAVGSLLEPALQKSAADGDPTRVPLLTKFA